MKFLSFLLLLTTINVFSQDSLFSSAPWFLKEKNAINAKEIITTSYHCKLDTVSTETPTYIETEYWGKNSYIDTTDKLDGCKEVSICNYAPKTPCVFADTDKSLCDTITTIEISTLFIKGNKLIRYDNGKKMVVTKLKIDNGIYIYDGKGKPNVSERMNGIRNTRDIDWYSKEHKLLKNQHYRNGKLLTTMEYFYPSKGLDSSKYYNGKGQLLSIGIDHYNSHGDLELSQDFHMNHGRTKVHEDDHRSYLYKYDTRGNWIERIEYSKDCGGVTDLYGKTTYSKDWITVIRRVIIYN